MPKPAFLLSGSDRLFSAPFQPTGADSSRQQHTHGVDRVSVRSDTLSAIKRRSWALAENPPASPTKNPVPSDIQSERNVWRYLIEEQKKGRTHVSFADIMAARQSSNGSHPVPVNSSASVASTVMMCENGAASVTIKQQPSNNNSQHKPRPKPIIGTSDELDCPLRVASAPLREDSCQMPHSKDGTQPAGQAPTVFNSYQLEAMPSAVGSHSASLAPKARIEEAEEENEDEGEEIEHFEVLNAEFFSDFRENAKKSDELRAEEEEEHSATESPEEEDTPAEEGEENALDKEGDKNREMASPVISGPDSAEDGMEAMEEPPEFTPLARDEIMELPMTLIPAVGDMGIETSDEESLVSGEAEPMVSVR